MGSLRCPVEGTNSRPLTGAHNVEDANHKGSNSFKTENYKMNPTDFSIQILKNSENDLAIFRGTKLIRSKIQSVSLFMKRGGALVTNNLCAPPESALRP